MICKEIQVLMIPMWASDPNMLGYREEFLKKVCLISTLLVTKGIKESSRVGSDIVGLEFLCY